MSPELFQLLHLVIIPMFGWIIKTQMQTSERLAGIEARLKHIERVIDPTVPIIHRPPGGNLVPLRIASQENPS
jgi:hypothetical protein